MPSFARSVGSLRCGVAVAAALAVLGGCAPTFAPPVRAAQYGAPARLRVGDVELTGTVGGFALPSVGGPTVGVAVTDWLALEAGANLALASLNDQRWALGFLGPRFSYAGDRTAEHAFLFDLELGLGAGAGGRCGKGCSADDSSNPLGWWKHGAFGGYQGLGLGGRVALLSYYLRARVEESVATGIPVTFWPSASGGLEVDIDHKGSVGIGGGYIGYANRAEVQHGWFYQLTGVVFFDAFRPPAPPAPAP